MNRNVDLVEKAKSLINKQKYREALSISKDIGDPALKAAILIDSGFGASKSGSIREGVSLLRNLLENKKEFKGTPIETSLLYNVANGFYSIYKLKRKRRKKTVPPNNNDLRQAKSMYRKAIAGSDLVPKPLRSQIYTNYANCLSQFGRGYEAIEHYSKALSYDPKNGMAAGNIGQELYRIAQISGVYFPDYIDLARKYLRDALGHNMHLKYGTNEAMTSFSETLDSIEEIIDSHENFSEAVTPADEPASSKIIKNYISFCRENSLLLNMWVGDPNLGPANSDDISYSKIITDLDDESTVPELLKILNEIKETYSTARYLFYSSTRANNVIDEVSKKTIYFRFDDQDINSLHLGLCKAAYLRAFDVLDKVAKIANVYFGIGRRRDYFWYVFTTKQSRGQEKEIRYVAPKEIVDLNNYSLYALSDLCIDYFESHNVNLQSIDHRRNLISHDFLSVIRDQSHTDPENNEMGIARLYSQTLEVLQLAKYAILYAVSSVGISEKTKPAEVTVDRRYSHDHGISGEDVPSI